MEIFILFFMLLFFIFSRVQYQYLDFIRKYFPKLMIYFSKGHNKNIKMFVYECYKLFTFNSKINLINLI